MPKIERTYQPVFGNQGNNDEFAVFGSMKTGTPVYSKTLATLFQSPAFLQGWQDAVAADKAPFLEEMNALFLAVFQQIAYQFQSGIPEYDSNTTYFTNSFCQVGGVIYKSLTDENKGNDPTTDATNWEKFKSGGGSGSSLPIGTILALPATANYVPNNTVYISQPSLLYSGVQGGDNDMFYQLYQEYLTGDNPKLKTLSMTEYETEITEKGRCDSFGVDSENQTFKMPYIPRGMVIGSKDTTPVVGNGMTMGYTNGTDLLGFSYEGQITQYPNGVVASTGTYGSNVGTNYSGSGPTVKGSLGLSPDPTKSGAITLLNTVDIGYYMVVSNGSIDTDQIEATWSNYMNSLNSKANVDTDNFSEKGKEEVIGWGLPNYDARISIASLPFTAPIKCYVNFTGSAIDEEVYINNTQVARMGINQEGSSVSLFMDKGDVLTTKTNTLHGTTTAASCNSYFPLKGAK